MASAIYPLRKLQIGLEGTAGTLVAATAQLVGVGVYRPIIQREFETFPRGKRAPVTGGGFVTMRGSELDFESNLTYEEILYPLLTGILNDAAPTGTGPYTWTFTPSLSANAGTSVKSATLEYVVDDGSTKHFQREFGFAQTRTFRLSLAFNQPARIAWSMAGRAEQTSTMTAALTPITGRTQVPSNLFKVFIDNHDGTIGSTQKSATIRSLEMEITTGIESDFTLDGQADLDKVQNDSQMLTGTLRVVMEHNANAATEIGKWRTGTTDNIRLVRIKADNGAATTANRQITFDGAWVYTEEPAFSEENGIEIVTLNMALEYGETYAGAFAAEVINGLSAQP